MIASAIGKTFLDAYNKREGKAYTAEEFFEKIFFPLFYDDEKYMQWVINSPFVQELESSKTGVFGLKEIIKGDDGKALKHNTKEDLKEFVKNSLESRVGKDLLEIKKADLQQIKVLKILSSDIRTQKKQAFIKKLDLLSTSKVDASIAIGFPSSDLLATTSGQVTSITLDFSRDDALYSWIGSGLGVWGGPV